MTTEFQAAANAVFARACSLEKAQRVGNAVPGEAVDVQAALVRKDDLLARGVEVEQAVVEVEDGLHEGDLNVQAGFLDDADRLAELGDEHLLRLRPR